MPPVSPSNQLTHNSIAKDLLLLSLLPQVTCSALLFGHTLEGKCVYKRVETTLEHGFNPLSQGDIFC